MLEIEKLTVCFGDRCVLDAVSMSVKRGEVLGIVGESGSGKTMTALSVMGLLNPQAQIKGGSIRLDGRELTGLDERSMSDIRGKDIAMIFQEPMTSLNPSMRIGRQLGEAVRLHGIPGSRSSAKEIKSRVLEALVDVKLPEPEPGSVRKSRAENSSTKQYRKLMRVPQQADLPRRASQLRTGIFRNQGMGFPHSGQKERAGSLTETPCGIR